MMKGRSVRFVGAEIGGVVRAYNRACGAGGMTIPRWPRGAVCGAVFLEKKLATSENQAYLNF